MGRKSATNPLLVAITLLAIYFKTANSFSCYQCLSTDHVNPFQCNEYMGDVDLESTPCDAVYGAQYCIKHTGRFEGGLGTKRFCSSLDMGNYCNYIQQPGDELEYRSCVFTCSTNGCNPARVNTPLGLVTLLLIGFVISITNMFVCPLVVAS